MCSGRSVDGELPFDETLAMINLDKPNEDQLKLMTDGHGNIRWVAGQCCNGDWAGEALNPNSDSERAHGRWILSLS